MKWQTSVSFFITCLTSKGAVHLHYELSRRNLVTDNVAFLYQQEYSDLRECRGHLAVLCSTLRADGAQSNEFLLADT